jgi:manganese/zinc/iron transport system ATP- binding protein
VSAPAVEVRDLTVAYGEKPVLWDVDVDIPAGAMAAVLGPNGAGKSTLLKAMLGLVPAAAGSIRILGQPYDARRGRVAYVPQRSTVDWDFPTDALDVVMMGTYGRLGLFRPPGARERATAMQCLAEVGMQEFAKRHISQLSGGQQQRVFIARALAQDAEVFLLDEPLAGVDAPTEASVVATLRRLRERGRTVVAVHHDLDTVEEYFDYAVLLNVRIHASGPSHEVCRPEVLQAAYGSKLAVLGK